MNLAPNRVSERTPGHYPFRSKQEINRNYNWHQLYLLTGEWPLAGQSYLSLINETFWNWYLFEVKKIKNLSHFLSAWFSVQGRSPLFGLATSERLRIRLLPLKVDPSIRLGFLSFAVICDQHPFRPVLFLRIFKSRWLASFCLHSRTEHVTINRFQTKCFVKHFENILESLCLGQVFRKSPAQFIGDWRFSRQEKVVNV